MDKKLLQKVLKDHHLWLMGRDGNYADLRYADLHSADLNDVDLDGANLSGADLSSANLHGTNLSEANLSSANLCHADLRCANLTKANLYYANLNGADLRHANLHDAELGGTCLDPKLIQLQRLFVRECPPVGTHGGRIVWRTANELAGDTEYLPGRTYVAPVVSSDIVTECHPGIYAASRQWYEREGYNALLVRCYVRDGDWFITGKGAIRCKRIRVLSTDIV